MFAAVACVDDWTPKGGWSSPVVEDNKLLIGNGDGRLVRFDAESGNLDNNWRYPSGDGLGAMYSDAVVLGDNVYGVGYTCRGDECDGGIFGISLETGNSIWGQNGLELKTKLVGGIGVSGDTLFVGTTVIGDEEDSADGYFYAIDSSASAPSIAKWRIALDGNALSGVAVEGSTAFVGTMAGTVYAIDISDPDDASNSSDRISWTYATEGAIAGPLLVENGFLYFGDLVGNAYKLNISNRTTSSTAGVMGGDKGVVVASSGEWKFDAGEWVWAKPVIEDDTVYVSTLNGTVFAIEDSTGSEKWSVSIEGQIVSSPTLFDRRRGDNLERALAVPSGEKNVWAISVIDGLNDDQRELGVFVTDGPVKSTPIIHNNLLYVHTMNGDLKWYSVDDLTQRGCVDLKGGGRCD